MKMVAGYLYGRLLKNQTRLSMAGLIFRGF